ncbi:unnamed protein product [Microthlaspi erraticum]|uniref:Uncharacterized protein n=1 Tax=Microthlaspi erraticum TaxID=1685480 RepID=A0A6D2JMU0_9BRAS|nr:unnamed protein product [Microthlaspi erraticum]
MSSLNQRATKKRNNESRRRSHQIGSSSRLTKKRGLITLLYHKLELPASTSRSALNPIQTLPVQPSSRSHLIINHNRNLVFQNNGHHHHHGDHQGMPQAQPQVPQGEHHSRIIQGTKLWEILILPMLSYGSESHPTTSTPRNDFEIKPQIIALVKQNQFHGLPTKPIPQPLDHVTPLRRYAAQLSSMECHRITSSASCLLFL